MSNAAARAAVNAQRVADGLSPLPASVTAQSLTEELARRTAAREARTRAVTRGLLLSQDVLNDLDISPMDARVLDPESFRRPRGKDENGMPRRTVHVAENARHVAKIHNVATFTKTGMPKSFKSGTGIADRPGSVPVPPAIVGAGDMFSDRMSHVVEADDALTRYVSDVFIMATLRKRLADKNGRTVGATDILADGVSTIDDVRQDAYVRAAELWADLSARADASENDGTTDVVRCELGDLREGVTVPAFVVSRATRCRECAQCLETIARAELAFADAMARTGAPAVGQGVDLITDGMAQEHDGREVAGRRERYGRRSPIVGKWARVRRDGTFDCDAPVYVDDAVTPRVAVSRSIETAIARAMERPGSSHSDRGAAPLHTSIDGSETVAADVARRAPESFTLPGVSDALASLATAVTAAVLVQGGSVTAGSGKTGAASAGVSADAWAVLCALTGHADSDSGRRKVRAKLQDVRDGKRTLDSILSATVNGATVTA